jgi:hypothetical protein
MILPQHRAKVADAQMFSQKDQDTLNCKQRAYH